MNEFELTISNQFAGHCDVSVTVRAKWTPPTKGGFEDGLQVEPDSPGTWDIESVTSFGIDISESLTTQQWSEIDDQLPLTGE